MSNPLNQIGPWSKRANFSVDRHQQIVDGLNAVRQIIPAGDGTQVVNGPFGQAITSRPPIPPGRGFAKVTGVHNTSGATLPVGYYSARTQMSKGTEYNPTVNLDLSTYWQDAVNVDDIYVLYEPENKQPTGTQTLKADGTEFFDGYWDGFAGTGTNRRPLLRVDAGGRGLPSGGAHYQVLMIIDNLGTWGIDWPRFH